MRESLVDAYGYPILYRRIPHFHGVPSETSRLHFPYVHVVHRFEILRLLLRRFIIGRPGKLFLNKSVS